MKNRILITVIFSFLFIVSCDEEKPVEPTPTQETIIADNTEQVDSNSFKTGLVSIDSAQIVYSSSNSFTQSLVVEGFIVSDYGEGILRKVESIQTQGSQVVVGTRQARLDEVLIKGKIEFNSTIPFEKIKLGDTKGKNVVLKQLNENIVIEIKDYKPLENDNVIINAGTTFPDPEIKFILELDHGIKNLEASINIQQNTYIEIETTTSVSLNFEYEYVDVLLATIPTPIPFLFINCKGAFGIGGQYSVTELCLNEVNATTGIKAGLGYNPNQGAYHIFDLTKTFTGQTNMTTIGDELRGFIFIPKLGFYISGLLGPYISNELFARYGVEEDNQGAYQGIWAGVAATAGLETDLFGFLSIGIINLELFSQEWEIWKNYLGGGGLSAPTLLSPPNESTHSPGNLTLDWTDITGATSYELMWDGEPNFGSPYSKNPTNSEWTEYYGLNQTIYWKVRATDGSQWSDWSEVRVFYTTGGGSGGLVAYYPFNGNANDVSGNGNTGTTHGIVDWVNDRKGNPNSAASFNGNSSITASTNNFPTENDPRTISLWVYSGNYAVPNKFLTGWGQSSFKKMSALIFGLGNVGSKKPGFWGWGQDLSSKTQLVNNEWYHIAFTYDGNEGIVYINAVNDTSKTLDLQTPSGTTFYIADFSFPVNNFMGIIDDIRIYDKALTAQEILDLYNE